MKFSSPNAPIFLVLWIMLQPLSMWVCAMLSEEFAASMFPDYMWYYGFPSGIKVGFAQLECAIWDMIGVTIVGAIIVFRHKVGGRKFWIHSGIWYAVYLILTMGAIYCIADDWGQVGKHSHVMISAMNCIYPPLVILILVIAVKVKRLLKRCLLKKSNEDNDLSPT